MVFSILIMFTFMALRSSLLIMISNFIKGGILLLVGFMGTFGIYYLRFRYLRDKNQFDYYHKMQISLLNTIYIIITIALLLVINHTNFNGNSVFNFQQSKL